MVRRRSAWITTALVIATVVATVTLSRLKDRFFPPRDIAEDIRATGTRDILFDEIRPVRLSNCSLERFGDAHDGGYLLCGNLLNAVGAGYSYGIGGTDAWGCDVSRRAHVTVHEYDCFDKRAPSCPGASLQFHVACVSGTAHTEQGRRFDTLSNQIVGNADTEKRIVVKMDVEGDEWPSLAAAPDDVLRQIDQLVVEFHHMPAESVAVVRRLKQFFNVVHVHFNNITCNANLAPFPAWAYEVLFVSKRLAVVNGSRPADDIEVPVARNSWYRPDCQ